MGRAGNHCPLETIFRTPGASGRLGQTARAGKICADVCAETGNACARAETGKTCADVRAETGRGSQVCPASGGAEIARIVRLLD